MSNLPRLSTMLGHVLLFVALQPSGKQSAFCWSQILQILSHRVQSACCYSLVPPGLVFSCMVALLYFHDRRVTHILYYHWYRFYKVIDVFLCQNKMFSVSCVSNLRQCERPANTKIQYIFYSSYRIYHPSCFAKLMELSSSYFSILIFIQLLELLKIRIILFLHIILFNKKLTQLWKSQISWSV